METNILEARDDRGWAKVSDDAPAFVKVFVTEFRTAALANRPMNPRYLASYTSGAETRSLGSQAVDLGRRVFRSATPRPTPTANFWNGMPVEEFRRKKAFIDAHLPKMSADEVRAHRLKRLGEQIEADAAALRADAKFAADRADALRDIFPWEHKQ